MCDQTRREVAEAASETARCRHCRQTKTEHGKMGFSCPAPYRSTFQPLLEEAPDPGGDP